MVEALIWNISQAVSTWNVSFEFDQDVVFQAWNGDIVKHTKSEYFTKSKNSLIEWHIIDF